MKVVLVNKFFFIKGGAETVYFQQRDGLRRAGVQVIDFSMQHPRNAPSAYAADFVSNVDYHRQAGVAQALKTAWHFIRNSEACRQLQALLQRERPDIVHFHNIYHQLTPALIGVAQRFGCKTVLTAHDYKIVCPAYSCLRDGHPCEACLTGTVWNAFRYRCQQGSATKSLLLTLEALWQDLARDYQKLDMIVSPSRFLRDLLQRRLPQIPMTVIPNGLDDSQPFSAGQDQGYFLFVGRLSPGKGVATLAQAHAMMAHPLPLNIAGDGPLFDALASRFPTAHFLGYCQQGAPLDTLIRGARAIVVPSESYENCSMAVLEAMAQGKPVIGAHIGGIPEQIRDGVEGLLFPPGDARALSAALSRLADDPALARRLGEHGRRRLCRHFSLHQHTQALLALYQRLLRGQHHEE
ncbi:glycosyltransferase family 4 protein [Edwardsiella piscicida]|nr:glycosyltransferase family 4 protein [Edwardsiella piscicida]UCQ29825.1 glycosyltransferase family 4 protein [Edwardsiella piscicida]